MVFRVDGGGGTPYMLRAEGTPSPLRNPHQYLSMQIASDAGIAPKLLYLDDAAGVVVTDFVVQRPLADYPGGQGALARAVAEMIRRVQAAPAFPDFTDYSALVSRLFAHVRRTGLFADGLLDAHAERLARLQESDPADPAQAVSAHNDLNARNVLFDGERLWLIDWESAYRNDPLVDVAIALDNFAIEPGLEEDMLRAWLGRAPRPEVLQRLKVVRALTRLYYAGVLLSASATRPRSAPDRDLNAPDVTQFLAMPMQTMTLSARVHLAGKVYLASFLSGDAVPPLHMI